MKWLRLATVAALVVTVSGCPDDDLRSDLNQWVWGDTMPPTSGNGSGLFAWQMAVHDAVCQLEALHTNDIPSDQRYCPGGPTDPIDPPRPPDFDD